MRRPIYDCDRPQENADSLRSPNVSRYTVKAAVLVPSIIDPASGQSIRHHVGVGEDGQAALEVVEEIEKLVAADL